jgi:hypothetical protein
MGSYAYHLPLIETTPLLILIVDTRREKNQSFASANSKPGYGGKRKDEWTG